MRVSASWPTMPHQLHGFKLLIWVLHTRVSCFQWHAGNFRWFTLKTWYKSIYQIYLTMISDKFPIALTVYWVSWHGYLNHLKVVFWGKTKQHQPCACLFLSPGYSTMSPQEDSENPPGNNDPLSAGVDVGNHDDDLDLDTPPQTAALLSHKFHPYRHTHTHHHPLHTHHLQAAVTVHSVDAECWSSARRSPCCCQEWDFF